MKIARALPVAVALLLAIGPACAPGADSGGGETVDASLTHIEGLGSLAFPNSGAEDAQQAFLRGVLLLHSFEYEPAAESFRQAQEIDPDFALAYWGEALTYNHPLWQQQDREAAMETLGRLAPTAEERAAKAVSDRERMYLAAIESLYAAEGSKNERDRAYMNSMAALVDAYPDDHEARSLWALSILGSVDGTRDFATYMKAAATAQPVFNANPDHPGAAHYLIHSFDDPIHAPLGLPAALSYSEIAPNAAHAQHMTSHIFVATGMWEDVVAANIRARDVQDAQLAERGRGPNVCGHYSSWLHYGHLMLDEAAEAESLMDACHTGVVEGEASEYYFAFMRARQILDTADWSLAERWQADLSGEPGFAGTSPAFIYDFTDAFAGLRAGETGTARAFLTEYRDAEADGARVQRMEIEGLLALAEGRADEGIEILQAAADKEDSMPFEFGPPMIVKPTFELLGEELLKQGLHDQAAVAFRRATERTPGRTLAENGLREARQSAR